jgi:hypothetical protein
VIARMGAVPPTGSPGPPGRRQGRRARSWRQATRKPVEQARRSTAGRPTPARTPGKMVQHAARPSSRSTITIGAPETPAPPRCPPAATQLPRPPWSPVDDTRSPRSGLPGRVSRWPLIPDRGGRRCAPPLGTGPSPARQRTRLKSNGAREPSRRRSDEDIRRKLRPLRCRLRAPPRHARHSYEPDHRTITSDPPQTSTRTSSRSMRYGKPSTQTKSRYHAPKTTPQPTPTLAGGELGGGWGHPHTCGLAWDHIDISAYIKHNH